MRDPLDEVEAVLSDSRRNCAQMKEKARSKPGAEQLFRGLFDTYLARLDVMSNITGADVDSFENVLAKLEREATIPRKTKDAYYPEDYVEQFRSARSSLVERFKKLRDGKSPIG